MDDQTRTDDDLARAWEGGDEHGFESLVTRYAPLVYARCRRSLGVADADDASQAVFLVLARKRAQAAANPALAAWLTTVADNVVRNARRDRDRRRRAESAMPIPFPSVLPSDQDTSMHGLSEHLDACVAQLPKPEREAVVLHHLAGHSVAEVAEHTGSGLSTVKERLGRGLTKLRKLLSARGVELGMAPLIAQLDAEAVAPVPASVLDHIHRIASISFKAGAAGTTAALSARVVRWSYQGFSPMTYVAIIGTPLLLTLGAIGCSMFASESAAPVQTPARPAAAVPATASRSFLDLSAMDPEHARTLYVLRWNDGARTAERVRHLPELALLQGQADAVLAHVAGVREATVTFDIQAMLPTDERVRQYRLQKELASLPTNEQIARLHEEMKRVMAQAHAGTAADAAADKGTGAAATPGSGFPTVDGSVVFADPTSPDIGLVRTFLESGTPGGSLTSTVIDGGWNIHAAGSDWRVLQSGPGFHVGTMVADQPAIAPIPAGQLASRLPAADLEMNMLLDPGTAAPYQSMGSVALTVTPDGLHLLSESHWGNAEQAKSGAAGVRVDPRRFAAIPAQAFLAGAVAMSPAETRSSTMWQSIFDGLLLPMQAASASDPAMESRPKVIKAVIDALQSVDGSLAAWIEPGSPLPTLTLEADMPKAAADALIACADQTPDADGAVCVSAGMAMLWIGWHEGTLVCTTNPGGLAAVDRTGGFSAQPEVVRALAAMPKAPPSACVLVRPAAMMHAVGPFVGMIASDQQARVLDYEKRLQTDTAYGFFTIVPSAEGVRMEASGMLALIGGAVLAAQMAPKHANN